MVVRSVIGKHYARVGIANLLPLLIFALLDRLPAGFGMLLCFKQSLPARSRGQRDGRGPNHKRVEAWLYRAPPRKVSLVGFRSVAAPADGGQ